MLPDDEETALVAALLRPCKSGSSFLRMALPRRMAWILVAAATSSSGALLFTLGRFDCREFGDDQLIERRHTGGMCTQLMYRERAQ